MWNILVVSVRLHLVMMGIIVYGHSRIHHIVSSEVRDNRSHVAVTEIVRARWLQMMHPVEHITRPGRPQGVDMEIGVQYGSPLFHGADRCWVRLCKRLLTQVIRPLVIHSGLNAYTSRFPYISFKEAGPCITTG